MSERPARPTVDHETEASARKPPTRRAAANAQPVSEQETGWVFSAAASLEACHRRRRRRARGRRQPTHAKSWRPRQRPQPRRRRREREPRTGEAPNRGPPPSWARCRPQPSNDAAAARLGLAGTRRSPCPLDRRRTIASLSAGDVGALFFSHGAGGRAGGVGSLGFGSEAQRPVGSPERVSNEADDRPNFRRGAVGDQKASSATRRWRSRTRDRGHKTRAVVFLLVVQLFFFLSFFPEEVASCEFEKSAATRRGVLATSMFLPTFTKGHAAFEFGVGRTTV